MQGTKKPLLTTPLYHTLNVLLSVIIVRIRATRLEKSWNYGVNDKTLFILYLRLYEAMDHVIDRVAE